MADIESNINLDIDASGAISSLKELQRQISVFQTTMAKTGAISNARLSDMQNNLVNSINSTGQFTASIQKVKTTTESFTTALEKNKLSMGQYFKYSLGATKTFGRGFKTEFDTIEKVARERVKTLQTQYIKLGRDASGAMQAIAVRPQVLDMKDLGTQTAIAAQKAQLFNQLMQQGSTNLLNFGKNTQWAGRQLMVGFTIPLGIMGAAAAKEFKAIEEQVIRLERVYGDFTTTMADTEQITQQIKDLGSEFTKYGVAVSKTVGLAADAAAMGKTGADLVAQVAEANRLAVLGGVDQQQSLETTISLTNSFGIAADQLSGKINFLNAVENQTVTSIEDLTEAIPKAGPVVQQLGGNVEDLTFFLTAMKEGGINASEGANALKSGLASLINPTGEAVEMLAGFGVNLQGIVEANKGNVKGIVVDFAKALDTLDPLNRAQAIEQLFGKFQFSRLSTLFQNVIAEGSQASRVLDLTKASAAELAALSERELGRIEASPLFKYQAAIENFKAAIAPVGEEFMKAVTPLINFGTQILESFNGWSDGAKQFAVVAVGAIGAIGPVLLMTFGLLANGLANIIKGVLFVRNGFKGLGTESNVLTEQLNYMNSEQLEAASISASLNQVHNNLIQTFTSEAGAVRNLAGAYAQAISVQSGFMGPITTRGGGMKSPKKFASGGLVPGSGNRDTVPAMLTPGEFVLTKDVASRYPGMIAGMMSGKVAGFNGGGIVGSAASIYGGQERMLAPYTMLAPGNTPGGFGMSQGFLNTPQFTQSLQNTLIAATATESGMRLTGSAIEKMASFAGPVAEQITQHLRDAEQELQQGGRSAEHISELFAMREKEIMASIPSPAQSTRNAVRKFAYATDEDIRSGGNVRVPGATVDQSGNVIRRTQYSNRTGMTSGFERRLHAVTQRFPLGVSGATKAHVMPEDRALLGGVAPLRGGGMALEPSKRQKAEAYITAASQKIVDSISAKLAGAVNKTSNAASPAKKFITAAAKNIVDGAIKPIEQAAPRAKAAGETVATSVISGTSQARNSRRASTGEFTALPGGYFQQRIAEQKRQERAERREQRIAKFKSSVSPAGLGMAGMVASGALSAMSGIGGAGSEIAGAVSGPLMAISSAASVLGMIPGPAGLVVAALGGIVTAGIMLKSSFDEAQRKAEEFAYSTGASSKALEGLAAVSGKQTAGQIMDARRQERKVANEAENGEPSFGKSFLESESGQALSQSVGKAFEKGATSKQVMSNVASQMATAISSGIIDAAQATSIIDALGAQLGDSTFAIKTSGKLTELIGPNGQDLLKDPVVVRVRLMQEAGQNTRTAAQGIQGVKPGDASSVTGNFGLDMLGAGAAGAGIGAGVGALFGGVGAAPGAIIGGAVGLASASIANTVNYMNNLGPATATFASSLVIAAQQSQEMLDSLKLQYEERIAIARAAGDEAKALKLTKEYEEGRLKLQQQQAQNYQAGANEYSKLGGFMDIEKTSTIASLDQQIKDMYKGTPLQAQADSAISQIGDMTENGSEIELTLKTAVASGDLDPITMNNLLTMMANEGESADIVANIITKVGAADADRIAQYSSLVSEKDGADLVVNFEAMGAEQITETLDIMDKIQEYGGNTKAVLDLVVSGNGEDLEAFVANLEGTYSTIENIFADNQVTEKEYQMLYDSVGIGDFLSNDAYYQSLPEEDRKRYIMEYVTVFKTATDAEVSREWHAAHGGTTGSADALERRAKGTTIAQMRQWYAQQAGKDAIGVGSTQPPPTFPPPPGTQGGGGGGSEEPQKPPTSFLDSIVKDMREFTTATQGLTENFVDSMNAIRSSSASAFGGLSQQLRGVGVGEDVISIMTGMSKEEWDQYKGQFFNFDASGNVTGFKADLTSIADKLRTITLGKFVDEQQKSLANLAAQNTALTKLVSLGMSYANAYKLIEDAAFAAAVANAKSADEIRQIIALAEQARKAQSLADASKSVAGTIAATDATVAGLNALIRFNGALTDTQTEAILASDDLQTMLANFDTLSIDQLKLLNEALKDAAEKEALEIKIKMQTPEGMQDLFNDGFSKAMEQFSAKEQAVKIKFETLRDPFEDVVKSFSNQIEDLKNTPGGLDDLEADLQRIGEQEVDINKKYDERYKALDSIAKINERVAAQQRTQLSLAEALSQGDIAAAARAAEEMRAQDAAQALTDQREALQKSQQLEIDNLTATMGMTRDQLEARIRDTKRQIFEIEEASIEPAQRQLDLLARQEEIEISALTVAGKTREEWDAIKNTIELARTNTGKYNETINLALGIVQELENAWKEIEKPKQTIHTIIEKRISEAEAAKATPAPAPAPVASTQPAPAAVVKDQAWIDNMARAVIRGTYGNGQTRKNNLGADYQMIQDRVNAHYYGGARLFNKGGLVASYMASGGLTKPMFAPKGTDTIPAMLTPGEFVVKKWAVDRFGVGNLNAINQGNFGSGSVYNYNMSVNVRSDANPDEIARTVMAQIKRVDAQRIRGNRF